MLNNFTPVPKFLYLTSFLSNSQKKLLSDPYVLFLAMAAMFYYRQTYIRHNFGTKYPEDDCGKVWLQLAW